MPWTPGQKRARYAELRSELERLLGPRCVSCGSEEEFTVDHEGGTRIYQSRRVSSITRLKLYLEDARGVKVRRLCNACNSSDGNLRRRYEESIINNDIVNREL